MQLRARLLAGTSSSPPHDLTRFRSLVSAAIAFNRHAGQIDIDSAIDTIYSHADPIDRAGFDPVAARRRAGLALREGGWREQAPGVWSRGP